MQTPIHGEAADAAGEPSAAALTSLLAVGDVMPLAASPIAARTPSAGASVSQVFPGVIMTVGQHTSNILMLTYMSPAVILGGYPIKEVRLHRSLVHRTLDF